MQIGSRHESSPRAKPNGKTADGKASKRAKGTSSKSDTLRLKAKHLVATPVDPADVASMIATAAYYRAAQRGFEPGHELDDWLQAEQVVRSQIPS